MKQQIQQLVAFAVLVVGIAAIRLLTGAMAEKSIKPCTYFILMAISGVAVFLDARWINRHFDGEEWT